jgi:hypothetical protein
MATSVIPARLIILAHNLLGFEWANNNKASVFSSETTLLLTMVEMTRQHLSMRLLQYTATSHNHVPTRNEDQHEQ